MSLEMTPKVAIIGSSLAFMAVVFIVVFLPTLEDKAVPSAEWRELSKEELDGLEIYKQNGCQYCHSMYVRVQDWDYGHDRIAQAGDYAGDTPPLLGTERQGPDLSQEGGLRSSDWHYAHFVNPRYTRPDSIMPNFEWLGEARIEKLTAYIQSRGYRDADARMKRQLYWKKLAVEAYEEGPIENMDWLHSFVPEEWLEVINYQSTDISKKRGEKIYQHFCIGCHGPVGDGMGPAAPYMNPPPFNFTYLARWRQQEKPGKGPKPLGGLLYYQVMNGITGTTMPPFKTELESEKIWDVSNYVGEYFAGGADPPRKKRTIPSSYEPLQKFEEERMKENR